MILTLPKCLGHCSIIDGLSLVLLHYLQFSASFIRYSQHPFTGLILSCKLRKTGGSLLDNLSQMIPNSQAESTTEIELIKSRMIIGKAVDDLGLDVSVERKFFPVFGKGWARLTGSKPQEIEVPRLLVPEILFGEELTLTVLDDQSFSLSDDDGEILKGKFGDLAFGQGVTVVVNNISAKAGATYYITKNAFSCDK